MTAFQVFKQDFKESIPRKVYNSSGKLIQVNIIPEQIRRVEKELRTFNINLREQCLG